MLSYLYCILSLVILTGSCPCHRRATTTEQPCIEGPQCPEGYVQYNSTNNETLPICFKIIWENLARWDDGRSLCQNSTPGADIGFVNTQDQRDQLYNAVVEKLGDKDGVLPIWIGAKKTENCTAVIMKKAKSDDPCFMSKALEWVGDLAPSNATEFFDTYEVHLGPLNKRGDGCGRFLTNTAELTDLDEDTVIDIVPCNNPKINENNEFDGQAGVLCTVEAK
ncbi:unnamed protein product [Caenorhabditis bovis]|uniref:C-type lectin domain-containing protein n=1 Tax=Caenorhabditis bovis TaxID=2654633 RepID=A0A8S1F1P6_9PELO|nr:unnamed protein product [Caenorhabditis bovis]